MTSHTETAEGGRQCPVLLLAVLTLVAIIAGALILLAMSWAEPGAARAKARTTELAPPSFDPPTSAAVVVLNVDRPRVATEPGCAVVFPLSMVPCR